MKNEEKQRKTKKNIRNRCLKVVPLETAPKKLIF